MAIHTQVVACPLCVSCEIGGIPDERYAAQHHRLAIAFAGGPAASTPFALCIKGISTTRRPRPQVRQLNRELADMFGESVLESTYCRWWTALIRVLFPPLCNSRRNWRRRPGRAPHLAAHERRIEGQPGHLPGAASCRGADRRPAEHAFERMDGMVLGGLGAISSSR